MIQIYTQNRVGTWFGLAIADQTVFGTSFGENQPKVLGNLLCILPFNEPFQVLSEPSDYANSLFELLAEIYEGKNVNLNSNLAFEHLPAYTQRVLKATLQIPVGYVAFYGSIAKAVGGGARAVGNIMANNAFAPIVPCHRVVKSDFTLGGYGGGLKMKYRLLSKEKRGYLDAGIVVADGKAFPIYPVEFALKKLDAIFSAQTALQ
jgi:O-6-methylguanine DNA methyltransferase